MIPQKCGTLRTLVKHLYIVIQTLAQVLCQCEKFFLITRKKGLANTSSSSVREAQAGATLSPWSDSSPLWGKYYCRQGTGSAFVIDLVVITMSSGFSWARLSNPSRDLQANSDKKKQFLYTCFLLNMPMGIYPILCKVKNKRFHVQSLFNCFKFVWPSDRGDTLKVAPHKAKVSLILRAVAVFTPLDVSLDVDQHWDMRLLIQLE